MGNVDFNNHKVDLNGPTAQAMGDYTFTDATSGDKVNVYYTFGYKRNDDGQVRIYFHHSSVPYSPWREGTQRSPLAGFSFIVVSPHAGERQRQVKCDDDDRLIVWTCGAMRG